MDLALSSPWGSTGSMRWILSLGAWVLGSICPGATIIAEVVEAGEAGRIELAYHRALEPPPARLELAPNLRGRLRAGLRGRVALRAYGERWWLESWWPVDAEADQVLRDPAWWREAARRPSAGRLPAGGVLGLDESGALRSWSDPSLELGFFLVPFATASRGELGEATAMPVAVREAGRFFRHLQATEFRDLPWILWSLEPGREDLEQCRRWEVAAFGEDRARVVWVSPLVETLPAWRERLGVVWRSVEGAGAVTNPLFLGVDAGGQLVVRYEGATWPAARLRAALVNAFRVVSNDGAR